MDIATWLRELGLGRYEQVFQEGEIDPEVLPELTDADLKDLGIPLGPRKKLLKAIAAIAGGTEIPAARQAKPAKGERRQLTVLFCDLVGSTELSARLDPEDMGQLVRAYQSSCATAVKRWDGHVARYMGDGVLAYFGWPKAHEDDAERAVRAGLDLTEQTARLRESDGTPLAARVGIATGLVMVGDLIGEGGAQEETVVGETPNLAARLQGSAEPGAVVIAQSTRQLLGGLFDFDDIGAHDLKGFDAPVQAWRVLGESASESRFEALHGGPLSPLIGREHEIGLLVDRWERAKEGDGQVVLLSGEPGIGKSRIIRALRERLAGEPITRLSHYCSPYHTNSALYPVIGLLERAASVARDDPMEVRLGKLEALLGRSNEAVPVVAALLGIATGEHASAPTLSPKRQMQRTLEVLVDQVERLAAQQPVLAVYEDLHWVDPTTLELLGLLIESVQRLSVLVLITFRPDFGPPWTGYSHVMHLSLSRLTRRHGQALVERVTGGKALPPEVLDEIVAKTDGVPLFVEELTKMVLESGLLTDAGDHYEIAGRMAPLAIPATLQDSLTARLDRLAPVKAIAQIGAVIGREFAHELISEVSTLAEDELGEALDQLVTSELIFRHGTPPDARYTFKHALVQDAAYQSLLKSRRRELHTKIAYTLERRFPSASPEVLAHHFTEAGLTDKAVMYGHVAGGRAIELSAYREAIDHLERALSQLHLLPPSPERDARELDLQLALGAAWIPAKAYSADEVRRAYGAAVELSRRVGNADQQFVALRGLWNNHLMRVELNSAKELATQLRAAAEASGDAERRLVAERAAGSGLLALGEHREANACFRRAIALYDPDRHQRYVQRYGEDPGVWCHIYAAWTYDWLGHRDVALEEILLAISTARTLTKPSLVIALADGATVHQFRRELEPTLACAEEAIDLADQLDMVQHRAWASIHRGWALACGGRTEAGLAEIEKALATWHAIGGLNNRTHFLNLFADACRHGGKCEDGMAALDEAEEISRRVDLHAHDVETHRRRGELLLAMGKADEAEAAWLRAIEVARLQETKTLELRGAVDLARLWCNQGRRRKAHDLLAPIYGWFTEGFDTADLKDATALLDDQA